MTTIDQLQALQIKAEGTTLLTPCVSCTFYFDHVDPAVLRDLADQAMAALDGHLAHFVTGTMRRFAKRNAKADAVFGALFDRPRVGARNWLQMRAAGHGEGVSSAELAITYKMLPPLPVTPEDTAAAIAANKQKYEVDGAIFMPMLSSISVSFPLDHPLAQPDALIAWVQGLACVNTPGFVSGHAGYALKADTEVGSRELRRAMDSGLAATLARHPGFDYEVYGSVATHLLKYWPGHPWFLPRFKRAQWLTFTRDVMLNELCGGRDTVTATLATDTAIKVHDLGDGLMIQAGDAPQIGEVTTGDLLPSYRHVAKTLAAARLPKFKSNDRFFNQDAATAWLEAFERDYD